MLILVKIGEEQRTLYMKTYMRVCECLERKPLNIY
jgi:hypothetical protein